MHAPRFLSMLALIAAAAPPQESSSAPMTALRLRLVADKASYLQLEPIRLWFEVHNSAATSFVLRHHVAEPAAHLRFYRVLPGQELQPLGELPCRDMLFCATGEDLSKPRSWRIDPGVPMRRLHWWPNASAPGPLVVRAAFEPDVGPDAGAKIWSDDVELTVVAPTGPDRRAYEFAKAQELVEIGGSRRAVSYGYFGFVSAGGRGLDVDGYFVEHFGDSLYADYVRYTMSLYLSAYTQEEQRRELLREILARRSGFPLRRECYAHLMELAKSLSDIDELDALQISLEHEKVPASDPWAEASLERLRSYREGLGSEGRRAAKRAFANRRAALEHPVVTDLSAAFGAGVRQRPEVTDDSVWMYLSDGRASWPVRVGFRFAKTGAVEAVLGSGALESWCHGRFAAAVRRQKAAHGLDDAGALKTFVRLELEDSRLSGSLTLPSGEEHAFTDRID